MKKNMISEIYSESNSTDVGMICNFMKFNIFADTFIHSLLPIIP